MVLDFYYQGFIAKILEKFPKCEEKINFYTDWLIRNNAIRTGVTVFSVLLFYMDILKDSYIVITIFYIIGGIQSLIIFPTNFTSVLVLSLAASVIAPLLLSSLQLACNNPEMVFNMPKSKRSDGRRFCMQFAIFLFLFFNPVFLLYVHKKNAKNMRSKDDEKILKALEFCRSIRIQYTKYIKIELSLEAFIQISIQIVLLLMSVSKEGQRKIILLYHLCKITNL